MTPDEFHGQAGAYVMRDGKRVRVEEPTASHPEGNCAREADGTPIERGHDPEANQEAAAQATPAPAADVNAGTTTKKRKGE